MIFEMKYCVFSELRIVGSRKITQRGSFLLMNIHDICKINNPNKPKKSRWLKNCLDLLDRVLLIVSKFEILKEKWREQVFAYASFSWKISDIFKGND